MYTSETCHENKEKKTQTAGDHTENNRKAYDNCDDLSRRALVGVNARDFDDFYERLSVAFSRRFARCDYPAVTVGYDDDIRCNCSSSKSFFSSARFSRHERRRPVSNTAVRQIKIVQFLKLKKIVPFFF